MEDLGDTKTSEAVLQPMQRGAPAMLGPVQETGQGIESIRHRERDKKATILTYAPPIS